MSDTIDKIIDVLSEDAILTSQSGHSEGNPRIFSHIDTRQGLTAAERYPYCVISQVRGDSVGRNSSGRYFDRLWYDIIWNDIDEIRARSLRERSSVVLVAASQLGDLDSTEGCVSDLWPTSKNQFISENTRVEDGAGTVVHSIVTIQVLESRSV